MEDALLLNGNYAPLVALRRRRFRESPRDLRTAVALGEAFALNGEFDRALALLATVYKKHPRVADIQYHILDVLFASGRDEHDFPWIELPRVVRLTPSVLDQCFRFLRRMQTAYCAERLYLNLIEAYDYIRFSQRELVESLRQDPRFIVSRGAGTREGDYRVAVTTKQ